jgi:hypothetical protein
MIPLRKNKAGKKGLSVKAEPDFFHYIKIFLPNILSVRRRHRVGWDACF